MADTSRNKVLAVIYASMAAGPIAAVVAVMGTLLLHQPIAMEIDPRVIESLVAGGGALAVIALIVALLPNTVGVTAMAWLSSRNIGLRHPAMWALAGGAATGVPSWLATNGGGGDDTVAFWCAIGAGCALVARFTVRWDD